MAKDRKPPHWMLIALGAIPILVWKFRSRTIWVDFAFIAYVLTAYIVVRLIVHYPGRGNRWYWKPIVGLLALHIIVIAAFAFASLAIDITGVRPPTAMFIGFALPAGFVESWVWVRLMTRFTPVDDSD